MHQLQHELTGRVAPPGRPHTVAVVGGGIFGWACAYQLAKRGTHVTLIERDDTGVHASGNNPGNINPIHGAAPALIPLALQAYALHRTLHEELRDMGCGDYGLRNVRRVLLAFDDADTRHLEDTYRCFTGQHGFTATPIENDALHSLDARLAREVRAGLLLEGNLSVDSAGFLRALAHAARKLGVHLVRGNANGVQCEGGKATGVFVQGAAVHADAFAFATGPWVAQVENWLGLTLPIKPVKGEMLRIALPGPALEYDFTHGLVSLYRRGTDECWIGVTKEDAGFDTSRSEAGKRQLLEAASRIMPAVADAPVLAHTAALRPMSANGLPLVGPMPGKTNCFIANGGGIKGMLLAPAVGLAITQWIVDGDCTLPFEKLGP